MHVFSLLSKPTFKSALLPKIPSVKKLKVERTKYKVCFIFNKWQLLFGSKENTPESRRNKKGRTSKELKLLSNLFLRALTESSEKILEIILLARWFLGNILLHHDRTF